MRNVEVALKRKRRSPRVNPSIPIARPSVSGYNLIMMKQKMKRRLALTVVLLLFSAALMISAAYIPDFAEWYSETIYPLFVTTVGRIWGYFPFSVSEILLYILIMGLMLSLILLVKKIIGIGKTGVAEWLSGLLLVVGVLAFLYTICCGINYHRKSFSEETGIVTSAYSVEDLKEICLWLTDEVNAHAGEMERDGQGVMKLTEPEGEGAVGAMLELAKEFPELEGYYPMPKKVMLSEILSYQCLTGIYSPFTVEANYNGDMTAYNKPFTACHELSHLRGFMQEEEANFIAFLACIGSERKDFQYSGYLSGWIYCTNALYRADKESWREVRQLLDERVEPDLAANNAFWDSYEGTISETADKINDTYLRANGQADGVQSYNRMVDLIVAYRKGGK